MDRQRGTDSNFSMLRDPQTPPKRVRLEPYIHQRVIPDAVITAKLVNNGSVKVTDLTLINPKMMNKRSPILLDNDHFMIPDAQCHPLLKECTICMVPGCSNPAIKTSNGNAGLSQHLMRKHNINISTQLKVRKKKDAIRSEGGVDVLRQLNPVPKLTSQQRREKILDDIVNLTVYNNMPVSFCESPHFRQLCKTMAGTQTSPLFASDSVREALKVKAGLTRDATTWALCSIDDIALTMDHWTSCAGDTYSGRYTSYIQQSIHIANTFYSLYCPLHR